MSFSSVTRAKALLPEIESNVGFHHLASRRVEVGERQTLDEYVLLCESRLGGRAAVTTVLLAVGDILRNE